jgi:hypothetical protein
MEYLAKSPHVKAVVLDMLRGGLTAFELADADIEVIQPGGNITFNILHDTKDQFCASLNQLNANLGNQYAGAESTMVPHNRDHPGNRRRIVNWWRRRPNFAAVDDALTAALFAALSSGAPFNVSWQATPGSPIDAGFDAGQARIVLSTDRKAVSHDPNHVTP